MSKRTEPFQYESLSIGQSVTIETDTSEIKEAIIISIAHDSLEIKFLDAQLIQSIHPALVKPTKKRQKHEPHAPTWLVLCMDYLPEPTWTECYVLERSWMIHCNDPNMYYSAINTSKLVKNIKQYFSKIGLSLTFWNWIESHKAIFTGSALLAFLHGIDPFGDFWKAGDIDIFKSNFDIDQAFECRKDAIVRTPRFGLVQKYNGPVYGRTDQEYTKNIGQVFKSLKYSYDRCGDTKKYIINVVHIKSKQSKNDSKSSREYEEFKRPLVQGESLHDYCLANFDIDILACSFDGNVLKLGDNSIWFQDRLAMLVGRYTKDPLINVSRTISRISKYMERKLEIENLDLIYKIIRSK